MPFTLKVQGLTLGYREAILSSLSFEVSSSHTLFIIGSNGKGKSTLGKTLLGLTKSLEGSIQGLEDKELGYMPQIKKHNQNLPITTKDFLNLFQAQKSWKHLLLQRLELHPLMDQPLSILSAGQWQRVNLAQALLTKPQFVIFDEPASGLDLKWQKKVYDIISQYAQTFDALCVCISHDNLAINKGADYILCLDHLSFSHNKNKTEKSPAFTLLDHQHKQ